MNVYKLTYWYRVDQGVQYQVEDWGESPTRQVKHGDHDLKWQVADEVQ